MNVPIEPPGMTPDESLCGIVAGLGRLCDLLELAPTWHPLADLHMVMCVVVGAGCEQGALKNGALQSLADHLMPWAAARKLPQHGGLTLGEWDARRKAAPHN